MKPGKSQGQELLSLGEEEEILSRKSDQLSCICINGRDLVSNSMYLSEKQSLLGIVQKNIEDGTH
jgi:hypothetical protein